MKPTELEAGSKELFIERILVEFESLPEVVLVIGANKDKVVLKNGNGIGMEYERLSHWNLETQEGRIAMIEELYGDRITHRKEI